MRPEKQPGGMRGPGEHRAPPQRSALVAQPARDRGSVSHSQFLWLATQTKKWEFVSDTLIFTLKINSILERQVVWTKENKPKASNVTFRV